MFCINALHYEPESTNYSLIALFTTELNAYKFMAKLKNKFPYEDFEVSEWHQPIVDPIEINEVYTP